MCTAHFHRHIFYVATLTSILAAVNNYSNYYVVYWWWFRERCHNYLTYLPQLFDNYLGVWVWTVGHWVVPVQVIYCSIGGWVLYFFKRTNRHPREEFLSCSHSRKPDLPVTQPLPSNTWLSILFFFFKKASLLLRFSSFPIFYYYFFSLPR